MIFLISMAIAILFTVLCGKGLRAHPASFYLGAVVIAVTVSAVTWSGAALPVAFATYVWPVFARGGLAGALFILVMWAGAFPNGSTPIKKLMPIRGQLSILASILTLGHNAAYGKVYFVRLFTDPASLPANQRAAAVCSVAMLVIMLPLFVTSFQCVRRKMKPKTWKRLQRFAYGFYGLLACHILLLTVPSARRGESAYLLTVFVYGTAFLSYLVCRVSKALAKKGQSTFPLAKKQALGAFCCAVFAAVVTLGLNAGTADETPPVAEETSQPPVNDGPETDSAEGQGSTGYRDGTYTGSAMGMNAMIQVSVTIENGEIVDITIDSVRDDEPYFSDALEVLGAIIASNSTQVDTVSGATYSSGGIIDAVAAALESAGS